jgi:plasmid maintenance system killer protein
MKIIYKNRTAERQFDPKHEASWRYPKAVIRKLKAMNTFMACATSLSDIVHYPPYHFHQLKGDRKHEWALNLGETGYRVSLIPLDDQENEIVDGDIIHICKLIKIVLVTEVSNHYE